MELKLSNERFEEIKKMILESPKKALKSIKKEEMLDFIADTFEINSKVAVDLETKTEEYLKLTQDFSAMEQDLNQAIDKLDREKKDHAAVEKDMKAALDKANSVANTSNTIAEYSQANYEKILSQVKKYRIASIVLAVIVVLQMIF